MGCSMIQYSLPMQRIGELCKKFDHLRVCDSITTTEELHVFHHGAALCPDQTLQHFGAGRPNPSGIKAGAGLLLRSLSQICGQLTIIK